MYNICDAFQENPYINPKTGRAISTNGLTFKSLVNECADKCERMGYEIFQVFDMKYRSSEKIFETERSKTNMLFTNGLVTINGYEKIRNLIDMYEKVYTDFIVNVEKNKTFVEKSSSGGRPRPILNSKDWAEAIIELIDIVNIFKRDLKIYIDISTNRENISKECKASDINECGSPCVKKKTFYRKEYCDL